MAERTTVAWTGAASSLAVTCVIHADRLAKFFGIINIPKDARDTMSALSSAPMIHGTNTSDFALKEVSAIMSADMKSSQWFTMRVNPHGVYLQPDKSASVIPPRTAFDLVMSVDTYGMTAEDFLKQYGSLHFNFSYKNNGLPGQFTQEFIYSYLEDQIAFIEQKTRKGM
jgi:tRNA splicing ligase